MVTILLSCHGGRVGLEGGQHYVHTQGTSH